MPDQRPSEVLGGLPRTRPQRRSAKRPQREDSAGGSTTGGSAGGSTTGGATGGSTTGGSAGGSTTGGATGGSTTGGAQAAPAKASGAKRRTSASKPAQARSSAKPTPARPKRSSQPLRQPPQPGGIPAQPRAPVPPRRPEILGTAVQAGAELAEIGLALSARALRRAVSRIPRP